jgi:hypothetical protein
MQDRILIVCPTRSRPQNAELTLAAWKETTSGRSDLVFAIDDDQSDLYPRLSGAIYDVRPRKRMIPRFNEVAMDALSQYAYIGFIGDDHRFRTKGWEDRFMRLSSDQHGWIIAYGDDTLKGEALATAAILSSGIIAAWGHVCPQTLMHMYMDDVWMVLGKATGCLKYMPDVIIEHVHYGNGKAPYDAAYGWANAAMNPDCDAYNKWLKDGGFDADVAKLQAARGW